MLLLLEPLSEDSIGLEGNCSTFRSVLDKFISIVTSLFGSDGDLWLVKGSLCDTGVVATGLNSPAKSNRFTNRETNSRTSKVRYLKLLGFGLPFRLNRAATKVNENCWRSNSTRWVNSDARTNWVQAAVANQDQGGEPPWWSVSALRPRCARCSETWPNPRRLCALGASWDRRPGSCDERKPARRLYYLFPICKRKDIWHNILTTIIDDYHYLTVLFQNHRSRWTLF